MNRCIWCDGAISGDDVACVECDMIVCKEFNVPDGNLLNAICHALKRQMETQP